MLSQEQIADIRAKRKAELKQMAIDAANTGAYSVLSLAGRCANGAELDSGTLYHAVVGGRMALCGQEPGRRSVGWSDYVPQNQPVTCPRCASKIKKGETKCRVITLYPS